MGKSCRKWGGRCIESLVILLLFCGFSLLFLAYWCVDSFGLVGFEAIRYTLFSSFRGIGKGNHLEGIINGLLPALVCTLLVAGFLLYPYVNRLVIRMGRRHYLQLFPFPRWIRCSLMFCLAVGFAIRACLIFELPEYIQDCLTDSTFIQEHYVEPSQVQIIFPKKKRNLVYIFLESVETSFFSKQEDGGSARNAIPELYRLAQENLNFSHTEGIGGGRDFYGATWTIGAMVSHTAGLPLKVPMHQRNKHGTAAHERFMPGVISLMDILHQNGYQQALMVGSDASFGGRRKYYEGHGVDHIFDIFSAREEGIVPLDYHVWWGMEDLHLFEYAKRKLPEMARAGKPFAFSLLTVDTHRRDGYVCERCERTDDEQMSDVLRCSSRQVVEFVQWLQAQPFYRDTVVILCGDHLTMDVEYAAKVIDKHYIRRVYNCFLNVEQPTTHVKNREFLTCDMFPTTLAAMGCKIEGERLGLGTNLFSGRQTLVEAIGYKAFQEVMELYSSFYNQHFIYPFSED